MEAQEGVKPSENVTLAEVVISQNLLTEVVDETKQRSIENSGEFLVFIMDKGKEQVKIRVGIGHGFGVSYSPEEAIRNLRPFVNEGFKIMADYHNHTPESLKVYKEKGMPAEYAFSPSYADLSSDVPEKLKKELAQNEYPHLIGVYLPDKNKVCINGFQYNREPSAEENKEIEFDDPFYQEEKPDELGIQLLASKYTDPRKLKEKGIINSVQIKSSSSVDLSVVELNTHI